MKASATMAMENPGEEISALVRVFHETQERLQELAGGELDAVVIPGGQSYLLHAAQEKLRQGEAAQRALAATQASILDALPAHIALIDPEGVILSVNEGWRHFAEDNGPEKFLSGVGQNYLEICERARGPCAEEAFEAAVGIRRVMSGASRQFSLEYPCHSPTEQRWFQLIVSPIEHAGAGGAVVMHVDITARKLAEEHLEAGEVLLRQFIEHAPAAIAMLDTEMRYLQASERWVQDYHLDDREIIGKSHYEIFPDLPESWKAIHRRVLAGDSDRCEEDSFVRADGSVEWLQWETIPWRKAGGEIGGLIFFTQVITGRKLAERALKKSEESFRRISAELAKVLDSSLDVICTFDAEGRFTQVNAACERVWGYRPEELLGRHFLEMVHPDDVAETHAVDTQIMAGSAAHGFENRYVRKDGAIVHLMWSAWWSEADQSNFCVAHDVTDTHEAKARTQELAERLELAVTASKVGIWDVDLVTGAMLWDEQMYALYGATRERAHEGLELWRRHLHPDDAERASAEFEEAARPGGRPFDTVFRIVLPATGETRHIRAQGRPFRDPTGRPLRMLGTNWDVTEQVERENMLRQKLENERALRRQALAGEKAKSEFLAVMSHEIRTPMNGVLGFAEMLANSPELSPGNRELSETIVASGEALLRIIDDILDFSRIEAGRLPIENRAFSPGGLVRDIEALFVRQIRAKGLEFLVSVDAALPASLPGDAGRIRQILVNLVGNALKFTEHGAIALSVRARAEAGVGLEFVVRDTGRGVAADQRRAIFKAFTQADSSTSRRHGGTGLGLTISRRLAELMGGTLRLMSEAGEGSTFVLRLPVATDTPEAAPEAAGNEAFPPPDAGFARRHPLRILVAEDDKVNLKLVVRMLGQLGFEPLAACDGEEAFAIYEQEAVDCVLMDVQMPGMDGIEATKKIRVLEQSRGSRPAFISALTANILPEDRARCVDAGMNSYLNKPVKLQAIAGVLIEAWKLCGESMDDRPALPTVELAPTISGARE